MTEKEKAEKKLKAQFIGQKEMAEKEKAEKKHREARQEQLKKDFRDRFTDDESIDKWIYNMDGNLKWLALFLDYNPMTKKTPKESMDDFLTIYLKKMNDKMVELKASAENSQVMDDLRTLVAQRDFTQYVTLPHDDCYKYRGITGSLVDKNIFVSREPCVFRFRNNMTRDYVKAFLKIPVEEKKVGEKDYTLTQVYQPNGLLPA